MVELSNDSKFHVLEREKVQHVVDELNLTSAGLTSRESVAKIGNLLGCDWLISGTIAKVDSGTYLWTKVISVRDGILRDLNVTPYSSAAAKETAGHLAKFVARNSSANEPSEFVALGSFQNLNAPGGNQENWALRLKTILEKESFKAGYGVTDISAINPIFQERRLEAAGLKAGTDRVELRSDFWLVDGAAGWADTSGKSLMVGLRVQRVGGPEQLFRITNAPAAIESQVVALLQKALSNTNKLQNPGPNAESDLLAARGMELATRRSPFGSGTDALNTHNQRTAHLNEAKAGADQAIATYRRTLLSDPENIKAVSMLTLALLAHEDPEKRAEGKQYCEELLKSRNPALANIARARLAQIDQFTRNREDLAQSDQMLRKDYHATKQRYEADPNNAEAKCDYGEALIEQRYSNLRDLGKKLLGELAAGDSDQAARAKEILARPEKSPAIQWNPPAARQVAASPRPRRVLPEMEPETAEFRNMREFLQRNADRFTRMQFGRQGDLPEGRLQRLAVQGKILEFEGRLYCGFRFRAPEWMDGDLHWMHFLMKTEAQKDFSSGSFRWCVVPLQGRMHYPTHFNRHGMRGKRMQKDYPYTNTLFSQQLPYEYFKPGDDYLIAFSFTERDMPDIGIAITIDSERGRKETGFLPMR